MKRLALATALTLLLALLLGVSTALAAATYSDSIRGIEISPGVVVGNTRIGATFVGQAAGQLPGAISVSINYTPSSPKAGETNTITGGLWTLTVIENKVVKGTLVGKVTGGSAAWDADGVRAEVNATMAIAGGTGRFRGVRGTGTFDGFLSHEGWPPYPPTWGGALQLTY